MLVSVRTVVPEELRTLTVTLVTAVHLAVTLSLLAPVAFREVAPRVSDNEGLPCTRKVSVFTVPFTPLT